MKRIRPPQPGLAVRVAVAERQFKEERELWEWMNYEDIIARCNRLGKKCSLGKRLKWLLGHIFEDGEDVAPHELHHDPALILREYHPHIEDVASRYRPHAHNPDFLVYLAKDAHLEQTTGRKPGAERTITVKGSDIGLAAKFRRIESGKPKRKQKIPQRKNPWQKKPKSRGVTRR